MSPDANNNNKKEKRQLDDKLTVLSPEYHAEIFLIVLLSCSRRRELNIQPKVWSGGPQSPEVIGNFNKKYVY